MGPKEIGRKGEDAAAAYLERQGMRIQERNWRCPSGEIDVIAWDGDTLVLCEVKTRRTSRAGTPEEAVSDAKQRRLASLARAYIARTDATPERARFDVIAIRVLSEDRALLRHLRNAFSVPL